ncbi:MAG: hemolysin D [Oleiphilaceae bacterium]|jgi:hemolysin D
MSKHSKLTNQFLPAALEVESTPPPRFARAILWSLLVLIVISVIWTCLGKVDIMAVAQGKLVPSGKVKTIQSLEAGIVKHIYVTEGQSVTAGDMLLALDSQINEAEIHKLENEIAALSQDIVRSNTLLDYANTHQQRHIGSKNNAPQKKLPNTSIQTKQDMLLLSGLHDFDAKTTEYAFNLKSLEAQKKTTLVNVNRYQKTLPLVESRASSLEQLSSQSLVSTDQYLQVQQEYIEQQEALAYEQARVEEIDATINATTAQQQSFVADYSVQRNTELNQYLRQLDALQQDLKKATTTGIQQVLKAPVSGVIENLMVTTIGGVVTPAQELMQLVPKERSLVVEAGLENKDIGFVTVGQNAEIKLEAFPFMKYGLIHGEIINVSADAIEHEQLGLIFPIKVALLSEKIMVNGKWVNLQPGMQATVEVKTGQRRIIEFLLAPVLRGLDEGIRER